MKNLSRALFLTVLLIACGSANNQKFKGPEKVSLEQIDGKYRLYVNGQEFYVKGAGIEFGNIASLAKHGGNSFRTWRTENGQKDANEILDEAQKYGLKVLMGLEVGRERHGYNYGDTAWVRQQFNYIKAEVIRLKDHPALLAWAIGNELNLGTTDMRIYDAVNDIAKMIHQIDPNHPTTTTTSGISQREADYIRENCPEIDFLSVQFYADIVNLQQRLADAGWDGPYMVTEWGATGHWEVHCTPWHACVEPTSHEKALSFIERYRKAIQADQLHCLGSYVFLWGQKQERTPTWYGMFLETGEETETVDAMHYVWNGKWPENRCPQLNALHLNGKTAYDDITLKVGDSLNVQVSVTDHDGDPLTYTWEIIPESTDLAWGGDSESRPETSMLKTGNSAERFSAPADTGAYRIYVYVRDGHNHAATANIPFYMKGSE